MIQNVLFAIVIVRIAKHWLQLVHLAMDWLYLCQDIAIYVLKDNIYQVLLVCLALMDVKFVPLLLAQHAKIHFIINHQLINVLLLVIQDFLEIQLLKLVINATLVVQHA